jgi:outer membrane protein OmpA-like peptidoglycan-associated protein
MAAQSMPMSPVLFASYSVPTALAAATAIAAPASEATPVLPVSCDPNLVMRTYFCTAQASLTVSARAMIERDLAQLRGCADGREIVVTGYADTRGMAARNAALSEGRAESVASFLRSQGLAVVTVAGAGETAGLEDDRNCAQQRRVDISFKGSAPPQSLSCSAPAAAAAMTCT